MISGFDVDSYNKPGFNFSTAWAQGYRAGYIKLGGDNLHPRYAGSGYQRQFNAFAAQPFAHRGCYWVSGGSSPADSARFYLAHRDPRTTFDVFDNESLDDGRKFNDAEASEFFDVLLKAGLKDLWQYGSRDSLWNQHSWPGLQARNIKALVALYNGSPFQNLNPRTYPASLVKGHQFTSSASIGGLGRVDADAFTDDAFVGSSNAGEDDMSDLSFIQDAKSPALYLQNNSAGKRVHISSPYHVTLLQRAIRGDSSGMLLAELDIVNAYESAISPGGTASLKPLSDTQLKTIGESVKVPVPASSLDITLSGKATS